MSLVASDESGYCTVLGGPDALRDPVERIEPPKTRSRADIGLREQVRFFQVRPHHLGGAVVLVVDQRRVEIVGDLTDPTGVAVVQPARRSVGVVVA